MAKLRHNGAAFIFECDDIGDVRKAQSLNFVRSEKPREWFTTSIERAIKLRAYADDSALNIFKNASLRSFKSPESLVIKKGVKLRPYQVEGVKFILSQNRTYLADDPGLGKTIQAINAVNTMPGKTLIICPPSLRFNWAHEIRAFGVDPDAPICMVNAETKKAEIAGATFTICPDSLIERANIRTMIAGFNFRWLFVDEAHRFKEEASARTRALLGVLRNEYSQDFKPIVDCALRVCLLSGTPMPNKPIELFSPLKKLAPSEIDYMSFFDFAKRYQSAAMFNNTIRMGASANLDELNARFYRRFALKRFKKDVLKDLPEKTREIIFLDGASKRAVEYTKDVLTRYKLQDFIDDSTAPFKSPLGSLAEIRAEIGKTKTVEASEFIRDILHNTKEKVIVFAWHKEVIQALEKRLRSFYPLVIDGGVSSQVKDERVRKFQNEKAHRLIIGNITAMGVGHTLTAAQRVVIVEPSWESGANEQAEDRAHRIGQKGNVFCQYLVLRGTLDEYVLTRVFEKQEDIDRLHGRKQKQEKRK